MSNWNSYSTSLLRYADLGFSLDLSLMELPSGFYANMNDKIQKAFKDIEALEAGEIANPDEGRMVGHYWLRNADLAPNDEIKAQITEPLAQLGSHDTPKAKSMERGTDSQKLEFGSETNSALHFLTQ